MRILINHISCCFSTLDTLEKFPVSLNSFDNLSNLVSTASDDVWVSVKGSAHVQLYDSDSLTCRVDFDVSTNTVAKKVKVSYVRGSDRKSGDLNTS